MGGQIVQCMVGRLIGWSTMYMTTALLRGPGYIFAITQPQRIQYDIDGVHNNDNNDDNDDGGYDDFAYLE